MLAVELFAQGGLKTRISFLFWILPDLILDMSIVGFRSGLSLFQARKNYTYKC